MHRLSAGKLPLARE